MKNGQLFYVVGASGAGKDSLIGYAKRHLTDNKVQFVKRYITRDTNAGSEEHYSITESEFKRKLDDSFFTMWWYSHGYHYGISKEIDIWLNEGKNVVMNGSRGYVEQALSKYPEMVTVLIEVNDDILRERLKKRGRENTSDIEKRIVRNRKFKNFETSNLIKLKNNDPLSVSGKFFIEIITS